MTAWWLFLRLLAQSPSLIPDSFPISLTTYPLRRAHSPSLSLGLSAMHAVGSLQHLVGKVGLREKQSLVAVVRGLEMYEQADLARGRWVQHG